MQALIELIKENQSFLLKRTLWYAKLHGYVKYTSTLEEAWIASISGLSDALINAIASDPKVPEIEVDHNFADNPISEFGVVEAQKHRHRGVSLEMFMSLMKYYRQSYLDLVSELIKDQVKKEIYLLWVTRFFDHNEISYCSEWAAISRETIISELQTSNRNITNEKNKYLTIFESMSTPALILDSKNRCINMNYSAQQLLQENAKSPGHIYYSESPDQFELKDLLPWLSNEYIEYFNSGESELSIQKDFDSFFNGKRNLVISFHRMLDVSGKFDGTVILINDMTEHINIEEQLRYLSFHDVLTGLYNRAYMEQEVIRLADVDPMGFISIDVDGLKLVNDNIGHHAGDALLTNISQILKKCSRKSDIIVRYGGDEFLILMPFGDEETVENTCQKIRDEITLHNTTHFMPISISMGWSVGKLSLNSNIHGIIKEADYQMYMDKEMNRPRYEALFKERFEKYGMKIFNA